MTTTEAAFPVTGPSRIRSVFATRYVAPLREGGSLPAIVEADDDGMYVVKFRGAGQGPKALIAELVAGEIGRLLGLPVPEIVFVELDPSLANAEPDEEIQELLRASAGLNLGLDYLPGALAYTPATAPALAPALAAAVVWFDAFVTNVDRTPRNPNLLLWHQQLWLIDHGASLYVQHTWINPAARSQTPFVAIADHVLLPAAGSIVEADAALRPLLSEPAVRDIIGLIPDGWLEPATPFPDIASVRDAIVEFLMARLAGAANFVEEAERARTQRV